MMTASTQLPGYFVNRSGFLQADQRGKHRKQTFKFGIIMCGANRRILSVVKNISETGALVEVDNAIEIPDAFTLAIESEPAARVCRVVWKKAKEIAVNFRGVPRQPTPERQEQRQIGRQERRQSPRRSLNAPGWIRLDGGFGLRECRIVDASIAGVRICLPFAGRLPETFTLLLSKNAQGHRVRTIWRRANQIGAKFI
jgi:hypothetical protein